MTQEMIRYYPPELHAKIGKFAAESGNKVAVKKFSKELGKLVAILYVFSSMSCELFQYGHNCQSLILGVARSFNMLNVMI